MPNSDSEEIDKKDKGVDNMAKRVVLEGQGYCGDKEDGGGMRRVRVRDVDYRWWWGYKQGRKVD